jgi:tetratricopeptide (TPR) repeat protein
VTGSTDSASPGLPSEWDPAIETLAGSLAEARTFRGSLVVVHGPSGIGKSRVINAALARAQMTPRRVRRTFLERKDTESPYKAVLSLARWAARLDEIAPSMDSGSLVLLPFLRSITASPDLVPTAAKTGEYQRLVSDLEFYKRGVEAWGERSRFLHEVGWLILEAAARRHIVWIVDGAEHLDPPSLSVVRYLAACLEESPLVMWLNVDTAEDGKLPAPIAALASGARGHGLPIPRLTRSAVIEVLGKRNPGHAFPDPVIDAVLAESRGLLLTVEQLAADPRLLKGAGIHAPDEGRDASAVVLAQLDGLSRPARDLIERLAIAGGELSIEGASEGSGRRAGAIEEDVNALLQAGFLLEQAPGRYSFRLGGLAAEIEARIPLERQRELHRAAANRLLESTTPVEEALFDLADHWRKAGEWAKAAEASLAAARFSSDSFAPEGGLLHAQRALDAIRLLSPEERAPVEAEALTEKGRALYDLGRLHEARDALRESLVLIGAAPAAWPYRARALFHLARVLSSLALPQEAFALVAEASGALAEVEDDRARMMLHQVIGVAFMMSNQNREAVTHFRAMLALAEELDDAREVSYAQKNLSAVLLALNPSDDEGWQLVNAALEQHTRTGNFAGLAAGYLNRSLTKLELKDEEGALKDLARSRQSAELAHAPLLIASATLQEATVRVDRAEISRAETLLTALAPWMSAMEEPWAGISFRVLLARIAESQSRSDDADRLYEEATYLAEPGGEAPALWECRLRRATLARRLGNEARFDLLRSSVPTLETLRAGAPTLVPLREALEAPFRPPIVREPAKAPVRSDRNAGHRPRSRRRSG